MLFALHTSGTTAKPKAVVHTVGGYLTYVAITHRWIFDIHDDDVYWCAADIGWVTGHSYIVYGPLRERHDRQCSTRATRCSPAPSATGRSSSATRSRQYYTAPTLIRAFIKAGPEHPAAHDLSSLRLLGSVGEPINPEAWVWYWKYIGGERCPIVDTWWQTETGGILITPLPGLVTHQARLGDAAVPRHRGRRSSTITATRSSRGQRRLPGDHAGRGRGCSARSTSDDGRYVSNYFSRFGERTYFPGDGARQDADGDFWLLGRVDDVMNVSGHRLSTIELESTLVEHPAVAEAAATAAPDPLTGQTPLCFVLLRAGHEPSDALAAELREWIGAEDRQDRPAQGRDHRRRPAEDALRQDHAPAAQGRRRRPRARRYDDPARPGGGRRPEARGRRGIPPRAAGRGCFSRTPRRVRRGARATPAGSPRTPASPRRSAPGSRLRIDVATAISPTFVIGTTRRATIGESRQLRRPRSGVWRGPTAITGTIAASRVATATWAVWPRRVESGRR